MPRSLCFSTSTPILVLGLAPWENRPQGVFLPPGEDKGKSQLSMNREALTLTANSMVLEVPASGTRRNVCCLEVTWSTVFCDRGPDWLSVAFISAGLVPPTGLFSQPVGRHDVAPGRRDWWTGTHAPPSGESAPEILGERGSLFSQLPRHLGCF